MKKKIWILMIVALIGIGGCSMSKNEPTKQEMIEVLKTEEAQKVIIQDIKQRDSNALTEYGIIKEYNVNYDSAKWNPMGGITFVTYVNGDNDLYIIDYN